MIDLLADISKRKIVVIGDVMLDVYFMGDVNRISPEAPVPVLWIKQKFTTLGGAGNVALNLAELGVNVNLVGVKGNDLSGQLMSSVLKKKGIGDHLVVEENHPTTTKTRVMSQRQQLIRLDEEDIWECEGQCENRLLEKIGESIKNADGVILSDYCKGVLTKDIPRDVIEMCKKKKVPVFIDPKRKEWERYQGATCITPNIAELETITGVNIASDEKKLVEQMQICRKRYNVEWFLATRGPEGMCLLGPDDKPLFIKSAAREVFDVSGAGDTVISTFAASVACGVFYPTAAEIANVAAGVVVGKVGSQPINIKELDSAWKSKGAVSVGLNRHKICTMDTSELLIKAWKAMNEKIVVTFGSFDVINPAHVHFLNHSKDRGDRLIVCLYTDDFIKKHKGGKSQLLKQNGRADILSAFECVDLVILLKEKDVRLVIKTLGPHIFIRSGEDLTENFITDDFIGSIGCKVEKISV